MNILEELTAGARERIREAERRKPFAEVRREAEAMERGISPLSGPCGGPASLSSASASGLPLRGGSSRRSIPV